MKLFFFYIFISLLQGLELTNEPTQIRCYVQMRKIRNTLEQNIFSMHKQIQSKKFLKPMLNSSYRILEESEDNKDKRDEKEKKIKQQKENKSEEDKEQQKEEQSSSEDDEDLEKINQKAFEPTFRQQSNKKNLKKIIKDLQSNLKDTEHKYVKNNLENSNIKNNYKNNLISSSHELYFHCQTQGGYFVQESDFQIDCKELDKVQVKILHGGNLERTIVFYLSNFFKNQQIAIDQIIDVYDFKHQFPTNFSYPKFYEEPEICTVFISGLQRLEIIFVLILLIETFFNQLQCKKIGNYQRKVERGFQQGILGKIICLFYKI